MSLPEGWDGKSARAHVENVAGDAADAAATADRTRDFADELLTQLSRVRADIADIWKRMDKMNEAAEETRSLAEHALDELAVLTTLGRTSGGRA